MKKRLLKKVLSAFVILAVSSCLINMHGQVKVIFENGDDRDDRQQGIAGRDALHLNYTIDGSGNIALDAVTPATDADIIAFVDSWDLADAGTTDVASLFGKSFSLVLTTNGKRLDCREKGGLGIQGQNSGRIDGAGSEILYITLEGSVGLTIDSLMYEPTERGGGDDASFVLKDYDTDSLFYLPAGDSVFIAGDSVFVADSIIAFDPGLLEYRFASDVLTVTAPDSLGSCGWKTSRSFLYPDGAHQPFCGRNLTGSWRYAAGCEFRFCNSVQYANEYRNYRSRGNLYTGADKQGEYLEWCR